MAQKSQPVQVSHPVRSPLAVYRFSKGYSQSALAREAGLSRRTIIRLEAGGLPNRKTARALAAVLDVDADVLFPEGDG